MMSRDSYGGLGMVKPKGLIPEALFHHHQPLAVTTRGGVCGNLQLLSETERTSFCPGFCGVPTGYLTVDRSFRLLQPSAITPAVSQAKAEIAVFGDARTMIIWLNG
ncbi:uncharacterized protein LDX57_009538 [Aspergillus melleus]|uniref:uncharacterized protein n=1 Tax=Aspergillus melleus TaxID=138277 RepID=UPI001E8EAFD4|nr:uncharacterized protein LDX57_009538 [Aspergillus melleus]KAH8431888.1 hypothetical protein LDX57_009538 [Aspergillus melleus]